MGFFNEREREIGVAKPQRGTPRAAAAATGAIIEYANAPGPLTVSGRAALDEISALIWDTDGSHNRHVYKVQKAGRVWMRLVLIRKASQNHGGTARWRLTSRKSSCDNIIFPDMHPSAGPLCTCDRMMSSLGAL